MDGRTDPPIEVPPSIWKHHQIFYHPELGGRDCGKRFHRRGNAENNIAFIGNKNEDETIGFPVIWAIARLMINRVFFGSCHEVCVMIALTGHLTILQNKTNNQ